MQHRLQALAQPRAIRMMALLPVVLAAALATGCGDKESSEGKATQSAARVNDAEITVHQINQILERQQGLRPEQADAASRNILEGLIDQQLAVAKAEEQKLDRDPQIMQLLEATRVMLVQGTGFNWPHPDHFRMVFLPHEPDLREAISRMAKFLKDYRIKHGTERPEFAQASTSAVDSAEAE